MTPGMTDAPNGKRRLLWVTGLVFLLAFAGFNWNLLHTANPALFESFQSDSDALVLNALDAGASALGVIGPDGFQPYPSQFGAQPRFFRAFGGLNLWTADGLAHINASLMAAAVALTTFLVGWRGLLVSSRAVLVFGLLLALSPMTVMIAGSLYWMAWSWFLPLLVSLWLGPRVWTGRGLSVAVVLWFVTLFVKNLFGYEFVSSIAISATVPIVFFGMQQRRGLLRTMLPCLALGAASALALVAAMFLHASSLRPSGDGLDGWAQIRLIAEKRVAQHSDPNALSLACEIAPGTAVLEGDAKDDAIAECIDKMARAQDSSLPMVLAVYSTFRRTLPYLGGPDIIDDPDLDQSRQALRHADFGALVAALKDDGARRVSALAALPLTALLVWTSIVLVVFRLRKRGPDGRAAALMLVAAALGPLSWVVLAKAHSYWHTHINFVLWMLPFVPLLFGTLFDTARKPDTSGSGSRAGMS